MTDRPILFSGPMVRALLDGRKTQTRRVLRPVRGVTLKDFEFGKNEPNEVGNWGRLSRDKIRNPDFSAGDILWVRETLRFDWTGVVGGAWRYDADQSLVHSAVGDTLETPTPTRWPLGVAVSIHMPRFLSRLTLVVKDVQVQRLQDISEADAKAEGAPWYVGGHGVISDEEYRADPGYQPSKRAGFEWLWGEIHGLGAWSSNPWVVALTFNAENRNIDST